VELAWHGSWLEMDMEREWNEFGMGGMDRNGMGILEWKFYGWNGIGNGMVHFLEWNEFGIWNWKLGGILEIWMNGWNGGKFGLEFVAITLVVCWNGWIGWNWFGMELLELEIGLECCLIGNGMELVDEFWNWFWKVVEWIFWWNFLESKEMELFWWNGEFCCLEMWCVGNLVWKFVWIDWNGNVDFWGNGFLVGIFGNGKWMVGIGGLNGLEMDVKLNFVDGMCWMELCGIWNGMEWKSALSRWNRLTCYVRT